MIAFVHLFQPLVPSVRVGSQEWQCAFVNARRPIYRVPPGSVKLANPATNTTAMPPKAIALIAPIGTMNKADKAAMTVIAEKKTVWPAVSNVVTSASVISRPGFKARA